jgi:glyoxylate carboligase
VKHKAHSKIHHHLRKHMSGKKILFWVLAVLVAAAVVFALVKHFAKAPTTSTSQQKGATALAQRKDIDPSQLPPHFPPDIALPGNVKVLQNYTLDSTSENQAIRVYETTKSLADEFKYYKDILTKSGYVIGKTIDQTYVKTISAMKGNTQIQVTIAENTVTRQKTVNVSSVEKLQ